MRVTVKKPDFLRALSKACRVADEDLMIEVSTGETFVFAMNEAACESPTVWIKSVFPADVSRSESTRDGEKGVRFVVNAKNVREMVKSMGVEDIEMTKKDGRMVVRGAKARFDLVTHEGSAADYLLKASGDISNFREIPVSTLLHLIDRSAYPVTGKGNSVIETGLLLEKDGSRIRMVGTDGHRLAMAEGEEDTLSDLPSEGIILPYAGVKVLRSLLSGCEDDEHASFGFSDSQVSIRLKGGETVLCMRLVEGTYPNYREVMPVNNDRSLHFEAGVLDSLKRVAIISNIVTIEASSEKVTFSSVDGTAIGCDNGGPHGDVEEMVDAKYESSHDNTKIHFNVGYLLDALNAIDGGRAVMLVKDAKSAAIVRPALKEPCEHQCIIMPVHI